MEENVKVAAYIASALVVGIGTFGPAIAQGLIGSKACENIGKFPESAGNTRTAMMIAMVFPETLSLFSLIISLLILFSIR